MGSLLAKGRLLQLLHSILRSLSSTAPHSGLIQDGRIIGGPLTALLLELLQRTEEAKRAGHQRLQMLVVVLIILSFIRPCVLQMCIFCFIQHLLLIKVSLSSTQLLWLLRHLSF